MAVRPTFLAPGQRYTQIDAPAWRPDRQLTIARLDRDPFGVDRVTFTSGDGQMHIASAEQLEAAIIGGTLVPVVEGRRPLLAA
jgi:hypothetical protein